MDARNALSVVLMLALTGCAATVPDRQATRKTPWVRYTCSDGQIVQAMYPDTHTAFIRLRDETHTLHIAISGSGARYIGDEWQWWTKGMHDGMLAALAPGESIASAPGIDCHAP